METKDVLTKLAIRNANLEIEIATLQAQTDPQAYLPVQRFLKQSFQLN